MIKMIMILNLVKITRKMERMKKIMFKPLKIIQPGIRLLLHKKVCNLNNNAQLLKLQKLLKQRI